MNGIEGGREGEGEREKKREQEMRYRCEHITCGASVLVLEIH